MQYNVGGLLFPWSLVMVIRAVVEHGQIRLPEPMPSEWLEGRELCILEANADEASRESDTWSLEMDALTSQMNDPEDWARIDAALADGDEQAKAYVRREMGLP
jgi:hypothetical protein